jgi:hypothetical protein
MKKETMMMSLVCVCEEERRNKRAEARSLLLFSVRIGRDYARGGTPDPVNSGILQPIVIRIFLLFPEDVV